MENPDNPSAQDLLAFQAQEYEKLNQVALRDTDEKIQTLIHAYTSNLDYGSIQVLEEILQGNLTELKQRKNSIGLHLMENSYKLDPTLKGRVQNLLHKSGLIQ